MEKEQEKKDKNGEKSALAQKAWDKIMTKAKGEKVKDDVNLLKKAVKKEEKRKKKSKKAWYVTSFLLIASNLIHQLTGRRDNKK